ncbi:putative B3 domain-containing protein At5g66980 isoform X2 [Lactuca sativa]|uniref:TF-B3 domain-containing protein n=1 Tax=Lactuca sativa TaxID=4236 RepID=A0A9R1VX49_LACSA|nr:putative B3 domain-containing protein At5g66980 isoform X2 [Lactuca sativa]KAJ0214231.1 hypothetical protein LSAT_V11C400160890 [Lactuca sativa]
MAPRGLPSFFKILLDRSAPHLELPPGFVHKHLEKKIPENPILLSRNGGYEWRLKIKKEGEIYYFADGWSDVVEDSDLGFGDFLVFWLLDESTFKLSIFSPNGCEKNFPLKIQDEHDDTEEEEEEEEKEEDNYDDDGGNGVEYEEDDDDDGGDIDGDDGDPFFIKIISKDKYTLRIPLAFSRLTGLKARKSIKMKNLNGKEWPMKLLSEGRNYTRYYLSAGWSRFRRANELCEGDKCLFKFLRSEDKFCLSKVTKKSQVLERRPRRQPLVEVRLEVVLGLKARSTDEMEKRPHGRSFKKKRLNVDK